MLSIKTLSGSGRADAGKLADYPREDGEDGPSNPNQVEDYYSQGQQGAPSKWFGQGAAALGLRGSVSRAQQIAVLMGEHPTTNELLGQKSKEGKPRRMGEDLTFSAPKSVSIAWAIGSPDLQRAIELAQDRAVARTLAHIENRLQLGRRGKGGAEREQVKLVASAYRHGSSREQDPQLHTHCVLSNLAQRSDGTWGAIENSALLKNKLALGALYRAELAQAMREHGFQIERDGDSFKLAAVNEAACAEFSRRREQIEAAMQAQGTTGAKAAEVASLATRQGKEITDTNTLRCDWQERAAAHGITPDTLNTARHLAVEAEAAQPQQPIYDRADVLSALARGESTFMESAVWREVAIAAQGTGMNVDAIEREVQDLMRDRELVRLRPRQDLSNPDKPRTSRPAQEQRYTTKTMLTIEHEMAEIAEAAQAATTHAVPAAKVDQALADFSTEAGFQLSDEQQAAVRHICEAAGDVKLIRGAAGAGKTTMAKAARMAWEAQGLRVRGAAISGKAARGLETDAGIKSSTIASLLIQCQPSPDGSPAKDPLTSNTVLMIDEAGMVGSRQMRQLLKLCGESGAKLVLIGDEKQLQAIDAGGAFRALQEHVGTLQMTQNQRQRNAHQDMAQAVAHAEHGEAGEALALLAKHSMVSMESDRDAALQETVKCWASRADASGKPNECIMITGTRASAAALNHAALEHQKSRGLLGPGCTIIARDREGKSLGSREILEGGRVLFKKNDKALGVMNGELGTVQRVDLDPSGRPIITVKLDRGESITIKPEHQHDGEGKAPPGVGYSYIEHGWAVTTHASQGATVDHAIVYADGSMSSREQTYVQISRMRFTTNLIFNIADLERDEDRMCDVPPTEKMISFAQSIATRQGIELTQEDMENFTACRDWLNEHAPSRIEKEADSSGVLTGDLERLRNLAEAMSKSAQKDTTLDYQIDGEAEDAEEADEDGAYEREPTHDQEEEEGETQ
jgi:Ti-type conjugative transfer relaxase TraA